MPRQPLENIRQNSHETNDKNICDITVKGLAT